MIAVYPAHGVGWVWLARLDSLITAQAILMRNSNINHRLLYSLLIVLVELELFSSTLMLMLIAIRHFVKVTLFIACTPPEITSTEHVFRQLALIIIR